MFAKKTFIAIFILCAVMHYACCQDAYVNTQQGIFKLTGGAGSCNRVMLTNECGVENSILSIALYKDTVYYNTWNGELKRFKPGVTGSCETLIESDFSYTSMAIDKNGIIYAGTEVLVRYDPYTKQLTHLGRMPFYSGGDMIFFKGKLLLAGSDPSDWSTGIFEINPDHLSSSKVYMKSPAYIGLLSYPGSCGNSRYFGLSSSNTGSTRLAEIDLDNKLVLGESCSIPMNILDAASNTEKELRITSILKSNPENCQGMEGRLTITAESSYPPITYTILNAGLRQSSGAFTNLHAGTYNLRIADARGCTKDTTVTFPENIPAGGCNDVFIPNAFTPNGDGKNDVFGFHLSPAFKDVSFQVFNRWGAKVFQATGGTISWNGNYNGILQPVGVYVYTLKYTLPNGSSRNIRGTLNLVL